MKWLEIAVYTTDAGLDSVCAALDSVGITGLSIEESRSAAAAFLRESVLYWDFADMSRIGTDRPCVKGYLADCPENYSVAEAAKAAVERLKTLDLGVDLGSLTVTIRSLDEEDWANNWKKYYKPLEIGSRLLVLPSWEPKPETDRVVLKLDPGMAFGTGAHHTTRMCLELLEKTVRPGDTMLDMGCGSGILSIASLLLGAKKAVAVDIDPIAETIARENAAMNGLGEQDYEIRIGNLISDEALQTDIRGQYPVVAANIVADVILALCPFAREVVAPGGTFIVSGIIDDREAEVEAGLKQAGFAVKEVLSSDCWFAIFCENPQ
ncbi:MAG: 50S ribosomal protein L11 methyltransferase [Clostridiales bacterium]|nr:50S ribosomal protein L11 methyltransferase [Clostridiales bacterium]